MDGDLQRMAPRGVDKRLPGHEPRTLDGLRVVELKHLPEPQRHAAVEKISRWYQEAWGAESADYRTVDGARANLVERMNAQGEAVFAALNGQGEVIGTGSVRRDDYYDGFCKSNGIENAQIGGDLFVDPKHRGLGADGLKIWEQLLESRLKWVQSHGGKDLTIFAEKGGDVDLVKLYEANGARLVRDDLHHADLGEGKLVMLRYDAAEVLERLQGKRERFAEQQREAAPPSSALKPLPPLSDERQQALLEKFQESLAKHPQRFSAEQMRQATQQVAERLAAQREQVQAAPTRAELVR